MAHRYHTRKTMVLIIQEAHKRQGLIPPSDNELQHWSELHLAKHAKISRSRAIQHKVNSQLYKDFAGA